MDRRFQKWVRNSVAAGVVVLAAVGCARLEDGHGYVPEASALSSVVVGLDTKATVQQSLGQPGTRGIVDDLGWYYVRSEYEQYLWRAPVEVDRRVVVVTFDESDVVRNIEEFGLEEGQVVTLSRRVTDSNTAGVSFLRQLFGNIGNFDAATVLADN